MVPRIPDEGQAGEGNGGPVTVIVGPGGTTVIVKGGGESGGDEPGAGDEGGDSGEGGEKQSSASSSCPAEIACVHWNGPVAQAAPEQPATNVTPPSATMAPAPTPAVVTTDTMSLAGQLLNPNGSPDNSPVYNPSNYAYPAAVDPVADAGMTQNEIDDQEGICNEGMTQSEWNACQAAANHF